MTTVTSSQPAEALRLANEIRLARAAVKRDLQAGATTITDALGEPCVQSMQVAKLLAAQRQWGPDRARRTLRAIPCGELVRVRDLTDRQRAALLEVVA